MGENLPVILLVIKQSTPSKDIFSLDFRILKLCGYDMILGADWMYTHSPVTFDLPERELIIKLISGERLTFHDETLPNSPCTPILEDMEHILEDMLSGALMWMQPVQLFENKEQVHKPEVDKLLEVFQDIFQEPTTMPPQEGL